MKVGKYAGDIAFSKFLNEIDCAMSIYEVKMFLAGILLSPNTVPPSLVADDILLNSEEEKIVFENEKQVQKFYSLLLGLWNTLLNSRGKALCPSLSPKKNKLKHEKEKTEYILQKGRELSAFYDGIYTSNTDYYLEHCFELDLADISPSMQYDLFSSFEESWKKGETLDQDIEEMLEIVDEFHHDFPKAFEAFSQILNEFRTGDRQPETKEEVEKSKKEFFQALENLDLEDLDSNHL